MSGRGREQLVNASQMRPMGIFLDFASRRLYWVDAHLDTINSCNFDGTNPIRVWSTSLIEPSGVVLYNRNLYFTDWTSSGIYRTASSGSDASYLQNVKLPRFSGPNGLVVYNKSRIAGSTLCSRSNGGCPGDRICLPELHDVRCVCSYGVANITTGVCEAPSTFLVFTEGRTIRGVEPSATSHWGHESFPAINTTGLPLAIDYNALEQRLYWTEIDTGSIVASTLFGHLEVVWSGLVDPRGLAVDWITGNVFYTDTGLQQIGVVTADGIYGAVIANSSLDQPGSIAIDPTAGFMYWADSGLRPRIEIATMDGQSRRQLVNTNLVKPAGITIDFNGQKLYWSDTALDRLERSNLDGTQRTLLAHFAVNVHPVGLVLHNNSLIFTEQNLLGIYRFPLFGNTATRIVRTLRKPGEIALYNASRTTVVNRCTSGNGGCVHFCLPVPHGRSCICASGRTRECSPTILDGPQSVNATVSTSVTFRCQVDGKGFDVTVEFMKNGVNQFSRSYTSLFQHQLRLVTAFYTLSAVATTDDGSYTCQATNDYGRTVSASGTLTVRERNICDSRPCQNGGTCSDGGGIFNCTCPLGYTGPLCENEIHKCHSYPCRNGGVCLDVLNRFLCYCASGYTGSLCETDIDECSSYPCQNGATCNDDTNRYSCTCLQGFTGTHCPTDIDECSSSPCQNGGTCNDDTNRYSCTCLQGFTGTRCPTDIDECSSSPCQNGGTCNDNINGYTCSCLQGFTGVRCQTNIDECFSSPCQNGGTCNDRINGYTCSCLLGFTGTHCQTKIYIIDECSSSPCQNGGTCNGGNRHSGGYSCSCPAQYTGVQCETKYDTIDISAPQEGAGGSDSIIYIVVGALGSALLIAIIIILFLLVKRRRHRFRMNNVPTRGTFSVDFPNPLYTTADPVPERSGRNNDSTYEEIPADVLECKSFAQPSSSMAASSGCTKDIAGSYSNVLQ